MRRTVMALVLAAAAAPAFAQTPAEVRDAVVEALAPLQKAQEPWFTANKQVCASCHHQYQPSLAYRAAREHGVPVNETIARADALKAFTFADIDRAIQYQYVIEPSVDDAYRMIAAHAAGVPPNLGAAIYARLLISRQNADGTWDGFHQRPPSSHSRFTMATLGLRAVQLYRHASQKGAAEAAVARARAYLEKNTAPDTEGRAYQLLGLKWAGADNGRLRRLGRELLARQQADGGWESRAGRGSDVYSTGQALVALHDGAGTAAGDAAFRKGIAWLLRTQAADGTWHATTRLRPPAPLSPPYFNAGYPYERDQFLSMSGASWAIMALSYALGPARPVTAAPLPETLPANVEPWVETVLFGTVADLRRLLDGGLSPNAATAAGGTTVLMAAAPDVEKMRVLLDRGADVNARAKSRFSALMVAAQYQEGDAAINLLLDRGAQMAPPEGPAPIFNANPFSLAAYAGNYRSLPRLKAAGGQIDGSFIAIGTSRTTPMLGAFKFGDADVIRTLLELGAPVDFADGNQITMLSRSVLNHELELAKMLIARGANVNATDKLGMTPLLWAVSSDFGDAAMVALLLESGAKADAKNRDGRTALELARAYGHDYLVPALARAAGTP
jgi:ankyrin repeat protein/cytochrome c553